MGEFLFRSPLAVAALSLSPAAALAQPRPDVGDCWYYPHMGFAGGWFPMIFGPIFMLIPLAVLILVVVFAVRWAGWIPQGRGKTLERTPLDILKARFARGEIDKAEFEDRRRALGE